MSAGGTLWRWAATIAAPCLPWHLRRRARHGKEEAGRLDERYGFGATPTGGPLLWMHAASVGETLSLLPLIEALLAEAAGLSILLTTGTVSSARLLMQRIPPCLAARVHHRFVPLDVPAWAGRFLDGWRPDAAVFVESELWPNLLGAARRRGVPMALVNARMAERSARWWKRAPTLAREILAPFTPLLAQSEADAERFRAIGATQAEYWCNLKFAGPPLPADAAELARLRALLGDRPVWVAASTHPGEEALAIAAHQGLAAAHPGLLTIIVPRHPERGGEIAALAGALPLARRSAGQDPGPETAILLADTLGELGLFYRLAGVAFIGGSLVPHGGHNPLEPARLHCPIVTGPHVWNFADVMARLKAAGGLAPVAAEGDGAAALAAAVSTMLSHPDRGRAQAEAAAGVAAEEAGLPERIAAALLPLLPAPEKAAAAPGGRLVAGGDPPAPPGDRTVGLGLQD